MNHRSLTIAFAGHSNGAFYISAAEVIQSQLFAVSANSQKLKAHRIGQCGSVGLRYSRCNLRRFITGYLGDGQLQGQSGCAGVQHAADLRQVQDGERKLVGPMIPCQRKDSAGACHGLSESGEGDLYGFCEPQSYLVGAMEGILQIIGLNDRYIRISFRSGCRGWRR
ncbi:hypothetical protein D3C81_1655910 [compost metagenome]